MVASYDSLCRPNLTTAAIKISKIITMVLLLCAFIVLLSWRSAIADLYKYEDENGVTVYTDDISRVPQNQRKSSMVKTAPGNESSMENHVEASKRQGRNDERQQELINAKRQLADELAALNEEKKLLAEQQSKAKTVKEHETVNEKIQALNNRINAYNKRKTQLNTQIIQYNQNAM